MFRTPVPAPARIPAKMFKNMASVLETNPGHWSLLDRFMTPRTPQKADDRVVLAILGGAFASVACLSAVLMATRFTA